MSLTARKLFHPPSRRYKPYKDDNLCRTNQFHEYVRFDPPFTSVFCRFCGKHPKSKPA